MPALTPEQEAALQALVDQAQELDMGYEGVSTLPSTPLPGSALTFENWLASAISPPASITEYARLAYEAGRIAALQQPAQAVPDPVLDLITKHADRYLWLREEFATSAIPRVWQSNDSAEPVKCLLGDELDAAIDTAIGRGAAPGEPGQ